MGSSLPEPCEGRSPGATTDHPPRLRPWRSIGRKPLGRQTWGHARGAAPRLPSIMRHHDEGGLYPLVARGIERAEGQDGCLQGEGAVFLALDSTRSVPVIQEHGCSAERVSGGDRRGSAPGPCTEPCPETAGCRRVSGQVSAPASMPLLPRVIRQSSDSAIIGHFSACPAFVCHWCLLPWSIREALVRRKARHQCTNTTTGA